MHGSSDKIPKGKFQLARQPPQSFAPINYYGKEIDKPSDFYSFWGKILSQEKKNIKRQNNFAFWANIMFAKANFKINKNFY